MPLPKKNETKFIIIMSRIDTIAGKIAHEITTYA